MENKIPGIIFEDGHILVLNKPAGLMVHADGRSESPTLVDWLALNFPELAQVGGLHTLDSGRYTERFGVVHRLDRETSGVLLVAKNDEIFYFLQRQFIERTVQKTYLAFVWGEITPPEGVIDLPIGRSREDFRQWTTGDSARGTLRKAITAYRQLQTNEEISLVELSPKTGRTHQLRVHMKAIGHPIICDTRYASKSAAGFSRVALHAKTLVVEYPEGVTKEFSAPLPQDFLDAIESISSGNS